MKDGKLRELRAGGASLAQETSLVSILRERVSDGGHEHSFRFLESGDVDGKVSTLSATELDRRARAIAATLQGKGARGERAILVYPPGLDFLAGFLGCLYAGVIAVPSYPPDPSRLARTLPRLRAIVRDSDSRFMLTTAGIAGLAQALITQAPELSSVSILATDTVDPKAAEHWEGHLPTSDSVAFLQYTSGSTGSPKGVIVTHGNILHNTAAIDSLANCTPESVLVSWLPTYHDMGLIGGILTPLLVGFDCVMMAPTAFLQRPVRWLQAVTRHRATFTVAPNFALDLVARKVSDADVQGLDLSSLKQAWNAAEPVRKSTLETFSARFAAAGFRPEAHFPCFGLAEATLVATGGRDGEVRALELSRSAWASRRVAPAQADDRITLVGCGRPVGGQELRIVHPETRETCGPDEVGEVWLRGGSVCAGYWNNPDATARTFRATLARGAPEQTYLRTGDLGFFRDGELFVAGRLKDVLIIRGANYYPQDIEETLELAHADLRPGSSAAVGVEVDGAEQLGIVAEIRREAQESELARIVQAIREHVLSVHGIAPTTVALIPPGALPKTSSGKVQRHRAQRDLTNEKLETRIVWRAPVVAPALSSVSHTAPSNDVAPTEPTRERLKEEALPAQLVEQVLQVISRASGYPAEKLSLTTRLVDDLGMDSLLIAGLLDDVQQAFGPLEELDGVLSLGSASVGEIVRLIKARATQARDLPREPPAPTVQPAPEPSRQAEQSARGGRSLKTDGEDVERMLMLMDALELDNPYYRMLETPTGPSVRIEGREHLNYSTYDYLGLSADPRVKAGAIDAIERFGTSASASRIASGQRPVHLALERALADFLGCEDALTFASGHATNVSVLAQLLGPKDLIIHDSLAHNSIVVGAKLSGAQRRAFPHQDLVALERLLRELRPRAERTVIAVEGVYSMDGDVAPLERLIELKQRYDAMLYVDEAHSLGVLGATGRGLAELAGVSSDRVDVWMGTLSKTLASCGGYVAGSAELIKLLKYNAEGFIYAAALSPANAGAALAALTALRSEPERVELLQERSAFFLSECQKHGIDTGLSEGSAIVPAIVGASVRCLRTSDALARRGINVQPILYPAVEEHAARLRFFISARHTEEQLRETAAVLAEELARSAPPKHTVAPLPARPRSLVKLPAPRSFRKVFVTGGTGFIGSRVVRRLVESGVEVRCLTRGSSALERLAGLDVELHRGDLEDRASLIQGAQGCDAVVHLACLSSWSDLQAQRDRLDAIAVGGTQHVLEAALAAGVERYLHVSSVAALNGSETPRIFDETAEYELASRDLAYSRAKWRADAAVREAAARGLDTVVVMPAEVYGPDDDALVTAGTLIDILRASPASACDGGTSVVHVDDVASGIVAALRRGRSGERYVLGGDNLTVRELTALVLQLAGRRESIVDVPNAALKRLCSAMVDAGMTPPIPAEVVDYATLYWFVDSSKAKRELGYVPRNAEQTLSDVIDWLRRSGRAV